MAVEGRPDRRATRRLRSDEGLARKLALAAGLAAVLPIVVAVVRALLDGWYPLADNALFVIRARDVLSLDHFPLLGERPDAAGQADERCVAPEHVAHAQLGHREVEHRRPRGSPEPDQCHDQRHAEDADARDDQPSVAAIPHLRQPLDELEEPEAGRRLVV